MQQCSQHTNLKWPVNNYLSKGRYTLKMALFLSFFLNVLWVSEHNFRVTKPCFKLNFKAPPFFDYHAWLSCRLGVGALHTSQADAAWRYLIDSANIPLFRSADEAKAGLVCSLCRKCKWWLTGLGCDVVHVTAAERLKTESTAFVVK